MALLPQPKSKSSFMPSKERVTSGHLAPAGFLAPGDGQWTETSYSDASWATYEEIPVGNEELKARKIKKKDTALGAKDPTTTPDRFSTNSSEFTADTLAVDAHPKKRDGEKKKEDEMPPVFPEPAGFRTWTKAARNAWLSDQMSQWKKNQEFERLAWISGAEQRRRDKDAADRTQFLKDSEEQNIRGTVLKATLQKFSSYSTRLAKYDLDCKKSTQWRHFMKCDGLPDPYVVTDMSTYLHQWDLDLKHCDLDMYTRKLKEAMPILDTLEDFIESPKKFTPAEVENFKLTRRGMKQALATTLDATSYRILRGIEERMKRESLKVARLVKQSPWATMCLWAAVKMPIPMKAKPETGKPITLDFDEIGVSVVLPGAVDTYCVAFRAAWLHYNHYSEQCSLFHINSVDLNSAKDLIQYTVHQHDETYKIRSEQNAVIQAFWRRTKARIRFLQNYIEENKYKAAININAEKEELEELQLSEPEPFLDARTIIEHKEDAEHAKLMQLFRERIGSSDVDLRRFRVLGGVILLNLFQQPPQRKFMDGDVDLTVLILPKSLKVRSYKVEYRNPPTLDPDLTLSEMDVEVAKNQEDLESLVQVSAKLPTGTVMWLEDPLVCVWNDSSSRWSTADVFEVDHDRLASRVCFRVRQLKPIAFAVPKYSNLPYVWWEMRPAEARNGVVVSLRGQKVSCDLIVVKDRILVDSLSWSGGPSPLDVHIGKKMRLARLVKVFQEAGLDIFPELDAYNFVEDSCQKLWLMENHHYHCMAFLSMAYNFRMSRFNRISARREIIIQLREYIDSKRLNEFALCMTTPFAATLLACTEGSGSFTKEPIPRLQVSQFSPDLYSLHRNCGSMEARSLVSGDNCILVETVFRLLKRLKMCSF